MILVLLIKAQDVDINLLKILYTGTCVYDGGLIPMNRMLVLGSTFGCFAK